MYASQRNKENSVSAMSLRVALAAIFMPLALSASSVWAQDSESEIPIYLGTIFLDPISTAGIGDLSGSSVSITGEEIENKRLATFGDVLRDTPGVSLNTSGGLGVSSIYVRGVGSLYPMSFDDSAVAFSLDGGSLNARHITLGTLDIESIEVLRGPQGTRSGVSALAGTLNAITRKPTRDPQGYLRTEFGTENQMIFEGAFGGPINDSLSGRVALRYSQSDHWIDNTQTGEPISNPEELAFRGSLLWEGEEGTSAFLTFDSQRITELPDLLILQPYDPASLNLTPGLFDPTQKTIDRIGLQLTRDFGNARLTSFTSYIDSANVELAAFDIDLNNAIFGFPAEFWQRSDAQETTFSQDIRLSSSSNGPLEWNVGAFYENSEVQYNGVLNSQGSTNLYLRQFGTEKYGLYADAAFSFTDEFLVTGGIRQSWVRQDYFGRYTNFMGGYLGDRRDRSEDALTGQLGFVWAVSEQTSLRGEIARGFQPGGYNIYARSTADSNPYQGATNDTIELGFDHVSLDGRLAISGTAFANRVENNHILSFDSVARVATAINIDTEATGAEFEISFDPKNGLKFSAGAAYVDADISQTVLGVGDGDIFAGNQVPDVPTWSANFAATYTQDIGSFIGQQNSELDLGLFYTYVGARQATPQNSLLLDAYHIVDLRVAIGNETTELFIAGENLFDETLETYGFFAPATATAYGGVARGRSISIGLSKRF